MASTISQFDALMKERYLDSSIFEKLMFPEHTLLGMLEKSGDKDFVGDVMPIPVHAGLPQGIGTTFTAAQTNVSNTSTYKWAISAGDYYGVVHIGDKVLKASRTNVGAFLSNKQFEIDGLYEQIAEAQSIHVWGNGGGAIAQLATLSTNDFTLQRPEEAANIEVGMTISASANDGSDTSHSPRDSGDTTTITAINRATGAGTVASAAAISGMVGGDYIFRASDFYGDVGNVSIKGVQSFITATDSPGALWGIAAATRATDPQRYAGCRVAASDTNGKSIAERIQVLAARMTGRYKAKMWTAGFLHPEDFQVLSTLLENQGLRPTEDTNTKFGYMKIDCVTANGRVPIYTDRHCPKGTFFGLRMADWGLASLGELVSPQNSDGFDMLRRATTTDYEVRLISYPALYCRAPKNQGRVSLT